MDHREIVEIGDVLNKTEPDISILRKEMCHSN